MTITESDVKLWMCARWHGIHSVIGEYLPKMWTPRLRTPPNDVQSVYQKNRDIYNRLYAEAQMSALEHAPKLQAMLEQANVRARIEWDVISLRIRCDECVDVDYKFDIGGLCPGDPAPEIFRLIRLSAERGSAVSRDLYESLYAWVIPYHKRDMVELTIKVNIGAGYPYYGKPCAIANVIALLAKDDGERAAMALEVL